jgi:hypothetical protein
MMILGARSKPRIACPGMDSRLHCAAYNTAKRMVGEYDTL